MQTAANISLVLTDCSSLKRFADSQREISYGGFYQQLASELVRTVRKREVLCELGDKLVELAEQAHIFRHVDVVEQASQILTHLQLHPQYQAVGLYYQALCIHRFGLGDIEHAARLLETVAENAPLRYRARAMISLGAKPRRQGDYSAALALYREAGRFVSRNGIYDPFSTLQTQRMVAVVNGLKGNHREAITLLEDLYRLAHSMRLSQPHLYYDYMNSLAVEISEVGRLEEAKNVSRIVLASPYANAYPEWRETRDEIELRGWRASRSTVALSRTITEPRNIVRGTARADRARPVDQIVPEATPEAHASGAQGNVVPLLLRRPGRVSGSPEGSGPWDQKQPARVLEFKSKKMPNESKHNHTAEELKKMMTADKLAEIMNLISQDISDYSLDKVILLLEEIARGEEKG